MPDPDPETVHAMAESRMDGFLDVLKGLASAALRTTPLSNADTEYALGGLGASIVDRAADDATSKGWGVETPNEGEDERAQDELSRLNSQMVMARALRLSRLRGASAILVLTEDSPSLAEPLNLDRIGTIRSLVVLDTNDMRQGTTFYDDPTREKFGEPMYYTVRHSRGAEYVVHETRLLRVPGPTVSKVPTDAVVPWMGRSVLDTSTVNAIYAYREGMRWGMRLLERKQQGIFKMIGMGQLMAAGQEDLVRKRMALVDAGRSLLNSVAVDSEDSYDVLNLSVSGIGEFVSELKTNLAACTQTPVSILFGQSPSGLQATGQSDLESHYGNVQRVQQWSALPALESLVRMIYRQRGISEPAKWQVKFNPLWVMSEKEDAEIQEAKARRLKTTAEAMVQIDGLAILDRDEIRRATAVNLPELEIDPDSAAPELEEPALPEVPPPSDTLPGGV